MFALLLHFSLSKINKRLYNYSNLLLETIYVTILTNIKKDQVLSNDVYLLNPKKTEATPSISMQKRMMNEASTTLLTLASIPFLGGIGGKHLVFEFGSWIAKESSICPSALFPSGTTSFFSKYI